MTKKKTAGRPRSTKAETPLSRWLDETSTKHEAFATKLGITTEYLYRLCRNERRPSLKLALQIEEATKGKVRPAYWTKD